MKQSVKSKLQKKEQPFLRIRIPRTSLLPPALLFIVLLFIILLFIKKTPGQNNLVTQERSQQKNIEPSANLGNTFEKGHKIAYLKDFSDSKSWMSVWIYDLDTETEREVVPAINSSVFCREGCPDRSFSFSLDGTRLAVDLLLNGEEEGFGIVDITQKKPEVVYIDKGIFYYDKNYDSSILYYKDLVSNTKQKIGRYFPAGWLSKDEVIMNYRDINQEKTGDFIILNTVTFDKKLIKVEQLYNQQKIIRIQVISPQKDKILLSFLDKPAKPTLGLVNREGALLSIFETPPPFEDTYPALNYGDLMNVSWSPDGKYIAAQIRSAYPDLSSNINIYDVEKNKLVQQIPVNEFLTGNGCWLSSPGGEILVSIITVEDQGGNTSHRVRLFKCVSPV